MNKVILMGRLTRDPEVRYSAKGDSQEQMCIARYTLAVDRRGKDAGADFPSVVAFGKAAEFAEKYLHKGTKIVLTGRIQTGSYTNRDGVKVLYNGYSGRRSRVCRKQGGSRTGTAGKRADGSGGLSDGQRRLYEHTGRDRRRTAVHIGTDGSRRQYIKRRWQQDRTGRRKGSRTRHNAPRWGRNKKLHILRGYVKIKP